MAKIYTADHVTIIRKKGDIYISEDINTCSMLTGSGMSDGIIRKNVIGRLRRDPSVAFVLEGKDGRCEEITQLKDGLTMVVRIDANDRFYGEIVVSCDGDDVYKDAVIPVDDTEDAEQDAWDTFLDKVTYLLNRIEEGDYSFVPEGNPHFEILEPQESGEPVGIYDAKHILEDAGYETEFIHTVGFVNSPVLFVDENEVVLLGSEHFGGEVLFLEMKRIFYGNRRDEVEEALRKVDAERNQIEIIAWEDGSWSFRMVMDDDVDEDNFLTRLRSDLSQIREFIGKVEEILGEELWPIMKEQRQLFIYETIHESLKLSMLKI